MNQSSTRCPHSAAIRLTVVLTILGAQPAPAATLRTLLDTRFAGDSAHWLVRSGQATPGPAGLRVAADSRVDFPLPEGYRLRTGTIRIWFVPPELTDSPVPVAVGSDCTCAIKVRTGRGEVELSDKWIKVHEYDEHLTAVSRVLFTGDHHPLSDQPEKLLELHLECGQLALLQDSALVARVSNFPTDLSDIHVATYRYPFEITHVAVEALCADTLVVNKTAGYVDVAGRYHPERLSGGPGIKQHHLVVWEFGRAAENALFTTYASDSAVCAALTELGGAPGNNLTAATWDNRNDPHAPEPRKRVDGPRVQIEALACSAGIGSDRIVSDRDGKPLDLRFAGNRANAREWRSGCIVCLESCPAGVVGNRGYTMRDLVEGIPRFAVVKENGLEPEDEVVLRLKVLRR